VNIGRLLIIFGLAIAALGAIIAFVPALRIGRLPGDFSFGGNGWRVYLPIGTSIVLSILLTAIFWFVNYLTRK
jgi:hypothetical protein